MYALWDRTARFATGTALGGVIVGLGEALYRDVDVIYSALMYAAAWALAGAVGGVGLAWLARRRRSATLWTTWGISLALAASALVLVRFAIWRDVLHERPGSAWLALAAGVGAAVVLGGGGVLLGRRIRRNFFSLGTPAWLFWAIPAVLVATFGLRTLASDDVLPTELPEAKGELDGRGVILVVVDTLRSDVIGAYGAGQHRGKPATPAIDALADESLLFTNVGAQASWTKPAMASIMTSRHVAAHDTMSKAAVLPESLPTISSTLQNNGVQTAAVVTNYNLERGYGFGRGFDEFRYLPPARYLGAPPRANHLAAYNVYRLFRERLFTRGRQADHFYRSGRTVNALGLDILDRIGNDDFFLWLHYMEPHDPYFSVEGHSFARVSTPKPPAAWADRMRAAYRDDVRRFDGFVGELVAALRARGLFDDVTLVFTSDHGEEFADHGGFYHGTSLYEELVHVPLMIRSPKVTAGVSTELARHIDLAPTIAARFGIDAPESWEGRDLLGQTPVPEQVIAEENHQGHILSSIRRGDDKLILANPDNPRDLAPEELYNLSEDPLEQYPIDAPDKIQGLRKKLREALERAKQGGAQAGDRELDADAEAELRALGYIE